MIKNIMLAKAYIEVTTFCGLSCSFCEPAKIRASNMDLDLFEKINKELQGKTKSVAYHILGDPLTLKNLKQYLDISHKYGHSVELTSSGHYLDNIKDDTLFHPSIKQINFSLSSWHANSKKTVSLEEYFAAIANFCKLSIKHPKRFINLRLWNLGDDTYNEFNKKIERVVIDEFGTTKLDGTKNRVAPYTMLVKDSIFSWPSIQKEDIQYTGRCYAISGQLAFLVDGTVVPCCMDTRGDMRLGNIKMQGLDDILSSARANTMLKGFKEGILTEKMCRTCGFLASRL